MSRTSQGRSVILVPVLAWAALLVLLATTAAYAFIPHAPIKTAVALAIAGAKTLVIVLIFMRLTRSSGLVKLTAAVGLLWLSLMFILGFCDLITRLTPA